MRLRTSVRACLALVVALAATACVPVRSMPLTAPALAERSALRAEVSTVSPSQNFVAQRGGYASVIAVSVILTNASPERRIVDLRRATLSFADPGRLLPEVARSVAVGGEGLAPEAIPLDAPAPTLVLAPGERRSVWVAFRSLEPLAEPDLPRRVVLQLFVEGDEQPLEVLLAEPATGRPRWVDEPVQHVSYGGVHAAGTFDEASFGILRASPRTATDNLVVGPSFGFGFRAGKLRGAPEAKVECCDLSLAFDLSWQSFAGLDGSVGPVLGYQALFALDDRPDTATWHGPLAGLRVYSFSLTRSNAGALPIRAERSVLGYASFTVAYTHWFRSGDDGGSPGGLVAFEHATPEW